MTAFALIIMSVGCATTPTPTGKEVPGVIAESPPALVTGSKFVFQETNLETGKITTTYTWIVKEIKEYEKKKAYWIDTSGGRGDTFVIYDINLNWRAYIQRGEEWESVSPCIQFFSWPLKVGKKWRTSYDYWDKSRGRSWRDQSEPVTVQTYEEIKVPAGTFQAFKIFRDGARLKQTIWYAPSIGIIVKRQTERTSDHYLGYGRWFSELVEYSIPSK